MAISMAELAKQLLTAKQPERYSEVMDRGPYSTGEPINIGYGADDQMSPLDAAALITSPVPVVGDVTGLAADVDMYMRDPESRNIPNYILSAAGVVPFLPAASQIRKGIKAFHGSPHSFDRFSTESIGTGEGAQQYGRGLYFAENEKVARGYRNDIGEIDLLHNGEVVAVKPAGGQGDKNDFLQRLKKSVSREMKDYGDNAPEFQGEHVENSLDIMKAGPELRAWAQQFKEGELSASSKGSMYEVNIDVEPDELLDWYKPLSEQPNITVSEHLNSGEFSVSTGQEFGSQAFQDADDLSALSGGEYYKRLQASLVDSGWDNSLTAANSELKKSGIKGIRYADAFTRHKSPDKQSMNYVIFDDRLISIAKKYGVAIPVAAAMLARATGEDTSQSFQEET